MSDVISVILEKVFPRNKVQLNKFAFVKPHFEIFQNINVHNAKTPVYEEIIHWVLVYRVQLQCLVKVHKIERNKLTRYVNT